MSKTLIGRVTINYGQLPDFMEAGNDVETVPDTAFYPIPLLPADGLKDVSIYQWVKWLAENRQVVISAYNFPDDNPTATGNIFRVTVINAGISTPVDADGVLTENTLNFAG